MVASMAWPWEKPTATSTSSWPWDSAKRSKPQPTIDILRRWIKGKETPLAIAACVLTAAIAWFLQRRLGGDINDVDARQRRAETARTARLKHFDDKSKPVRRHRSPPPAAASSETFNDPSRYRPASEHDDHTVPLQVQGEPLMVRDGGYQWQSASCILDTGNAAITVIDSDYAKRHAILQDGSVFGRPEEYTTLRGINPGAETRAPVVTACLSLRGREFTIKCAISPMPGSDVLVGMDVLRGLFSDGFVLAR